MKGKKHRLLIYHRMYRQRRGMFLLAAVVLLVFYVAIAWPLVDEELLNSLWLWPPQYDILILAASAVFFLAFLYKLVAPRVAYVQCMARNVRIQTPLYPLLISYRRIAATRPNQWGQLFPPDRIKRGQRRLLDGVTGEGVLILDLKGWPVSPAFLRWFIPDVMFSPAGDGLVLWVKDWMALNREITDFKDRRREAQLRPSPEASLYSRMRRG